MLIAASSLPAAAQLQETPLIGRALTPRPLALTVEKAANLPEKARKSPEREHPSSLTGKTYVLVSNDGTNEYNSGVNVEAGASTGEIIFKQMIAGCDIPATYDAATGTVTISTGGVIGQSENYGDVTLWAFEGGTSLYTYDVTATVEDNTITFDGGLCATVIYNGGNALYDAILDGVMTEANGSATFATANAGTFVTPLIVTKDTDSSLKVVGLSNIMYGCNYTVPVLFDSAAKTATISGSTPVDNSSTYGYYYLMGDLNQGAVTMNYTTSDSSTAMSVQNIYFCTADKRGLALSAFSINVDFNIETAEAEGGTPGDEFPTTATLGNIIYSLDEDSLTAVVTGCVAGLTTLDIPASITVQEKTLAVIGVNANAFNGNKTVTSITLPSSIRTLGTDAFRNVANLKTLYIEDLAAWCAVEIANGNANPIYNVFPTNTANWGHVYFNNEEVSTTLVIPEGVTSISRSFYGFKPLESVTLPETLKTLGDQSFANCAALASIRIPGSVESIGSAFWSCTGLENVTLCEGIKTIGASTFYGCKKLAEITLPASLEQFTGYMTFSGCNALTTITSNAEVPPTFAYASMPDMIFDDDAFENVTVKVPVSSVDAYKAADVWKEFMTIEGDPGIIPSETTADGIYYSLDSEMLTATVTGCVEDLTVLSIPSAISVSDHEFNVIAVAADAFNGNRAITSISIPASVISLGNDAFRNIANLRTLNIEDLAAWCAVEIANGNANPIYNVFPTNTANWGHVYFNNEEVAEELVIPDGVTALARNFYGFKSLTSVTMPETLERLGDQTFANCTGLTSVEIPASVKSIGSAFWCCTGLETITLSEGLETIGASTFYGCSALTEITIPSTVTEFTGYMTFSGCSALAEITCLAAEPPTFTYASMPDMIFDEETFANATLYVPADSKESYAGADVWKEFSNIEDYDDPNGSDSVDLIGSDADAEAVYFNLQGVRVDNPSERGVYIKVTKAGTVKVAVK